MHSRERERERQRERGLKGLREGEAFKVFNPVTQF